MIQFVKIGKSSKIKALALPIMKECGINPVVMTCARENVGSAKKHN